MMPISQSVGRRRPGAAILAALAGAVATLAAMATPGDAGPQAGAPSTPPPGATRQVGSASCSARGCHGDVGPVSAAKGEVYIKDGAFTTWRHFDPHARAYAVLKEPRSVRIAAGLKESLGNRPAHESKTCLACHATAPLSEGAGAGTRESEGVSCESCHGPARDWVDGHLSPGWRADPAARARDGMADLSDPAGRAKTCVACHVGDRSRGMDVNHDLIAAGHPRLNFEYSGYLASYPKHWEEKPGFAAAEGHSWAVGQAVTARAALELLSARARAALAARPDDPPSAAPWPELSESECFACHHSLEKPGWAPDRGGFAIASGRLPWGTWHTAMLPEVGGARPGWSFDPDGSPWPELRKQMARGEPDRGEVARLAGLAVGQIDGWLASPSAAPPTADQVDSLIAKLTKDGADRRETWDQMGQRYLAIAALSRAGGALKLPAGRLEEVAGFLDAARRRLGFPPGSDSPRGGRPAAAPGP